MPLTVETACKTCGGRPVGFLICSASIAEIVVGRPKRPLDDYRENVRVTFLCPDCTK